MAQMIWLKAKGQKQGDFKSDITRKGYEGQIDVLSFSGGASTPVDFESGMPSGRRHHQPVTFTKNIDKTSPLWANALYTNENMTEIIFSILRPAQGLQSGPEKVFYTVKLTNAIASAINFSFSGESRTETITLVFQTIEITYVDGGVTAADDWSTGYDNMG